MRSAVSSKETAKIWYLRIQGSRVGRWSSLNLQLSNHLPCRTDAQRYAPGPFQCSSGWVHKSSQSSSTKPYSSGHSVERANPTTSWYLTKRSAGKKWRQVTYLADSTSRIYLENRNCSGTIISSTHQIWNTASRSLEQQKAV